MELKTFQARSMSEALARVKAELGREAMILHTRTIKRGGLFGLGARNIIEITATTDPQVIATRRAGAVAGATAAVAGGATPAAPVATNTSALVQPVPAAKSKTVAANAAAASLNPVLHEEVHEIKAMVERVLQHCGQAAPPNMPAELVEYYGCLVGHDVAREIADQVIHKVRDRLARRPQAEASHPATQAAIVREELLNCVESMLPPAAPLQLVDDDRPTIVALVGPTGVGKTTTLAKLAAHMKLREGKTVGLITTDTYRIAAVEQLKTYAQIMQVPLIAVTTPQEMRAAVEELVGVDLILIDTAGRSQRDDQRIDELRRTLAVVRPDQIHLVLSSSSRQEQIRETIERFSAVGANHLIFTKLDEAVGFGVILNVLSTAKLSMSYFTTGQSVPDDIEIAGGRRLAQLLIGGQLERTVSEPAQPAPESSYERTEIIA